MPVIINVWGSQARHVKILLGILSIAVGLSQTPLVLGLTHSPAQGYAGAGWSWTGRTGQNGFGHFVTVLLAHHLIALGIYRCGEQALPFFTSSWGGREEASLQNFVLIFGSSREHLHSVGLRVLQVLLLCCLLLCDSSAAQRWQVQVRKRRGTAYCNSKSLLCMLWKLYLWEERLSCWEPEHSWCHMAFPILLW